jgi:RecA/RadA recombinase
MIKRKVATIKRKLTEDRIKQPQADWLSTGCTTLNLALSGNPNHGFSKGKYYFFVGDSSSGKTFFALTILAEASINKSFDDYRLIYDATNEDGAQMDIGKFFGSRLKKRLETIRSENVESFYFNLLEALENSKPCIYICDSQDALSSEYEQSKLSERRTAHKKGTKAKGDYGDGKAKKHSSIIRQVTRKVRDTDSILVLISQTRDNIDAGLYEPKKIFSGGKAIRFYATAQLWTKVKKKLTKIVMGKPRQIGISVGIDIKKNRLTGKEWSVSVPLYWSTGIDDVGGCVEFLLDEKSWKQNGIYIDASNVIPAASRITKENLIKKIQSEGMEDKLKAAVSEVWHEIEKGCQMERASKYDS